MDRRTRPTTTPIRPTATTTVIVTHSMRIRRRQLHFPDLYNPNPCMECKQRRDLPIPLHQRPHPREDIPTPPQRRLRRPPQFPAAPSCILPSLSRTAPTPSAPTSPALPRPNGASPSVCVPIPSHLKSISAPIPPSLPLPLPFPRHLPLQRVPPLPPLPRGVSMHRY